MKAKNKILTLLFLLSGITFGMIYQFDKNINDVKAEETIEVYKGALSTPIVGSIYAYSSETIPSGYLKCNGQAVSRTTYSALYAVIGTTYGSGDGSTTFNLPNLSGKVAVGKGTGTDTNSTSKSFTIGTSGGEATNTLKHNSTTSEIPSHNHTIELTNSISTTENNSPAPSAVWEPKAVSTSSSGAHGHSFATTTGQDFTVGSGNGGGVSGIPMNNSSWGGTISYPNAHWFAQLYGTTANGSHTHTATPAGTVTVTNTSHTHKITPNGSNANTGGSGAHNNVQPYTVVNYIIKY